MPGPEVGRRGDQGRRPELPVGVGHPGDGGPRGRALPAGGRLLHAAAAPGRDILVMPLTTRKKNKKLCLHYTHLYPPSSSPPPLFEKCLICLDSQYLSLETGSEAGVAPQLLRNFIFCFF